MRFETAASLKGNYGTRQLRPREGAKIRVAYDLFMVHKGHVVSWDQYDAHGGVLASLVNIYGLDIRRVGNKRYILAGEWFGKVYIDYIADRIAAESRKETTT